jgi:hypothetical protein
MNKRLKSNESSAKYYGTEAGKKEKKRHNRKRYYRTLADNLNPDSIVPISIKREHSYAQFLKSLIDKMDERFNPLLGSFLKKTETVRLAYCLNDDNIIDTS